MDRQRRKRSMKRTGSTIFFEVGYGIAGVLLRHPRESVGRLLLKKMVSAGAHTRSIGTEISCDSHQPRGEPTLLAKSVKALVRTNKAFLGQVVRVIAVRNQLKDKPKHGCSVTHEQRLERAYISASRLRDEELIGGLDAHINANLRQYPCVGFHGLGLFAAKQV